MTSSTTPKNPKKVRPWFIVKLLFTLFVVFVVLGTITIVVIVVRSINESFAQEEFDQVHLAFFELVDQYVLDRGEFPGSLLELEESGFTTEWGGYIWPQDSAHFVEIVDPQFGIELSKSSIQLFSPHFDELSGWSASFCRNYWDEIVVNSLPNP